MPRLTSKGQVTVPVAVRYALGLAPGDDVVFAVEDGRGVFRAVTTLDDLRAAFPAPARAGAHALERLLVTGDPEFADSVQARRTRGERLRLPDAVLLDVAGALARGGAPAAAVAGALRDVLADRAVRVDHPAAVRAAIDELAAGGDPLRAYALARG
ncbi:MAG TPA: AbrB/MazE/SpoVT family DNA-binding domain-containing protein [Gaiellales bacterium]|jgi:AbrB family looped-hinge helix DNA binding protein|nr:AbrB/MazE/SpoVT family DNA-binding domain-containing protein [Gaiellales bacterium]